MKLWPFEQATQRRKEIRRTRVEHGLTLSQRIAGQIPFTGLLAVGAFALLAATLVGIGEDPLPYRVHQVVSRPVTSRLEFRVLNENQTLILRTRARDGAPPVYQLDQSLLDDLRGRLLNVYGPAASDTPSIDIVSQSAARLGVPMDDAALAALAQLRDQNRFEEYQSVVRAVVDRLAAIPLVEPSELAARRTSTTAILRGATDAATRNEPVTRLQIAGSEEVIQRCAADAALAAPATLRSMFIAAAAGALRDPTGGIRAIYRFDGEASTASANEAEAATPNQFDVYAAGAILADSGAIDENELALLAAEDARYQAASRGWSPQSPVLPRYLGRAILAFIAVLGPGMALVAMRPRLTLSTGSIAVGAATLVAVLVLTRALFVKTGVPHWAVGAQAMVAALLAITTPRSVQAVLAGCVAAVLALATQAEVGFLMMLLAAGGMFTIGLTQVRSRGVIVAVGMLSALAVFAVGGAAGLFRGQVGSILFWTDLRDAAFAAIAAGFLAEGLLPIVERIFGVCTQMTLLEWCDANKPLMRVMAGEAPGTYNHSLLVGALAESAAESIGANGLLCRAGAYYHDIGKIRKPEYFVENQEMGVNRHSKLTPAMSHLVIINHVKDGVEMAREYRIPTALHPFIAEHHGTTVVEYFYNAANKARRPGDAEISDLSFRYPGPKPQSRETAIIMLCDAVEGAVRSMSDPTPARIEEVVAKIAEKRLLDGQFDECDLTFRELATVQKAVVKALNGIYHARIVYPDSEIRDEISPNAPTRTGPARGAAGL